jgi:transposase-like protein
VLGWLAHVHTKDREKADCPHHGWDEERQVAVTWVHGLEVGGRVRYHCSYCGRRFSIEASANAGWPTERGRERL